MGDDDSSGDLSDLLRSLAPPTPDAEPAPARSAPAPSATASPAPQAPATPAAPAPSGPPPYSPPSAFVPTESYGTGALTTVSSSAPSQPAPPTVAAASWTSPISTAWPSTPPAAAPAAPAPAAPPPAAPTPAAPPPVAPPVAPPPVAPTPPAAAAPAVPTPTSRLSPPDQDLGRLFAEPRVEQTRGPLLPPAEPAAPRPVIPATPPAAPAATPAVTLPAAPAVTPAATPSAPPAEPLRAQPSRRLPGQPFSFDLSPSPGAGSGRTSIVEKLSVVVAVILPPIGFILGIALAARGSRRRGWIPGVITAAIVVSIVMMALLGAGLVVGNIYAKDALTKLEAKSNSAAFCHVVSSENIQVHSADFGWPVGAASVPAAINAMQYFVDTWTSAADVAPTGVKSAVAAVATSGQGLLTAARQSNTVNDDANVQTMTAVAQSSSVQQWVSDYCG